jgi:hypothetical protein
VLFVQEAGSSRIDSYQNALLAGLAGQIFVFVKDDKNFPKATSSRARTCLTLLSYMAIVFNSSGAITSLILTDRLGELPIRASQKSESELFAKGTTDTTSSSRQILGRYGIGSSWHWLMWHCGHHPIFCANGALMTNFPFSGFLCLLAGITCIMAQILVYIILQESQAVKITMACVIGITTLPLLALVPFSGCLHR